MKKMKSMAKAKAAIVAALDKTLSPAHQYPGQYVCAGFYKTGITGTHYISGKFYYNGL